jgi:hypothetical protein
MAHETHEDHPTEFIVEGRDRATKVWRRMFVQADDKNAAVTQAGERGMSVELVREAREAERPMTGIGAPQRQFGFGGVMSLAIGILGVLSIAIALVMRSESQTFALLVGILGAVLTVYGIVGTTVFWTLSRANRDSR